MACTWSWPAVMEHRYGNGNLGGGSLWKCEEKNMEEHDEATRQYEKGGILSSSTVTVLN